MKLLADVLDSIVAAAALLAAAIFIYGLANATSGPDFVQTSLFALSLAILPYCAAGAVHRMWQRGRD